jgi:hypothetical protein
MWLDPREVATWMAVSCATSGIHLVYILYHLIYQLISTYIILYQLIWGWVNTYRYIFSGGTSINPSYDLGFTRYQGFDPLPYDKMIFLELRFMKWVDQPLCNWRKKLETPAIPQTAAMAWFQPRVWFENAHPLYTHWKWHIQGFPEFSL